MSDFARQRESELRRDLAGLSAGASAKADAAKGRAGAAGASTIGIRLVREEDADDLWRIFHAVVAGRDTYTFAPDTPREEALAYWLGPDITCYVAEIEGRVSGMYKLMANRRDLGNHVSNASFMVDPDVAGRGIGRALGVHCLREARAQGYEAMQFNFVVSTNERGVALWKSLGFQTVGVTPGAFRHGSLGLVDALVMHRFLDDIVLTFGSAPAEGTATPRASGYAVMTGGSGEMLLVRTREGILLPGGAIEEGESPGQAIVREVAEECALTVTVTGPLGDAIQFVHSKSKDAWFEKRSHFVRAAILSRDNRRTAEHEMMWVDAGNAATVLTYESHAWAIRRWQRLNT
jgi:GNAT superfamily N-acetyltransferase/8-oxo-dGTP pyrophosphatase MutT (NUDIX family)